MIGEPILLPAWPVRDRPSWGGGWRPTSCLRKCLGHPGDHHHRICSRMESMHPEGQFYLSSTYMLVAPQMEQAAWSFEMGCTPARSHPCSWKTEALEPGAQSRDRVGFFEKVDWTGPHFRCNQPLAPGDRLPQKARRAFGLLGAGHPACDDQGDIRQIRRPTVASIRVSSAERHDTW
jgi:hypothetical protein